MDGLLSFYYRGTFKKKGLENFKRGQTYIVICNHNTLLDVPVSTPSITGLTKQLQKLKCPVSRFSD